MQAGAIKAANKKVLGEVSANVKILQAAKDDSELGKASPGKISLHEAVKPTSTAPLARPATRPLAPKSISAQNVPSAVAAAVTKPTTTTHMTLSEPDVLKKLVTKRSTKVLRDAVQSEQLPAEVQQVAPILPVYQSLAANRQPAQPVLQNQQVFQNAVNSAVAPQRQEIRKTESVPLRDEPALHAAAKPSSMPLSHLPPGFGSEQEYKSYIDYHTAQYQLQQNGLGLLPVGGRAAYPAEPQPMLEQYYEIEEEYEYDDGYTTARSFGLRGESTGGVTTILGPKYTEKIRMEIEAAKEYVEATRTPDDIEDELWDTSMVAEYGDEIFEYMHDLEVRMAPNARYMEQQTEIQWSMRAVLMDWVIQVHQRFNLLPETLFLTVNYIDRFLSCKVVSLGKLQLVGATAIFVAAKYEEVQCPTIAEIIYMVDNGYSPEELLKAERFMLSMLQFELGWPGPMSFLRRISKADDYDLETRTLAKYFLEVTVMDERFVGCTPSFLAAGAHCMARLMIYGAEWSKAHVFYSNYTWIQLRQLLSAILECCEDPHKHHSAVYDKYTDKRYKRASQYVASKLAMGFRLPNENPQQKTLEYMDCMTSVPTMLR